MIKQTPTQLEIEKKKSYVFEHVRSGRIEGTNDPKQAKIIGKSPSWKVVSKPKKNESKEDSK